MIEFLTHVVLPIVNVLFIPFDIALGWVTVFGSLGALIAVGALTGLAVNLFQKFCSNQDLLGRRRADLERLKTLMREAKQANDIEKHARLSGLTSQISSKYALESLRPAFFSVPPLCILAMWVGSRLSFEPVRPGDVIEVVGTFEEGASGFSHVVPNDGLTAVSSPISTIEFRKSATVPVSEPAAENSAPAGNIAQKTAPPSTADVKPIVAAVAEEPTAPEARWKIRAEKEGEFALQVRHGEDSYVLPVPVHAKGGRPPEPATVFRTDSPTRDKLLAIELKLREPVAPAWWNIWMQAMGFYLVVALAFGLGLRRVMGIQ